jgi:hypothetical protein
VGCAGETGSGRLSASPFFEDLMKEDTIIYSYDVAKSPESLEMPSLGRVQALFMHELAFDLFSRYFPVYLWKVS